MTSDFTSLTQTIASSPPIALFQSWLLSWTYSFQENSWRLPMADPSFTVKELRGLYLSFDKDGTPLITSD